MYSNNIINMIIIIKTNNEILLNEKDKFILVYDK